VVSVAVGIRTGGIVNTIGAAGESGRVVNGPDRSTSPPEAASVISRAETSPGGTGGEEKFNIKGNVGSATIILRGVAENPLAGGGTNTLPVRSGRGE
jgi:hypothetical protein